MASYFSFVAYTAQADAYKTATERLCDGLAHTCLACARRANKTQNWTSHLAPRELFHRDVFEDPLLGFWKTIVAGLEDLFDSGQV